MNEFESLFTTIAENEQKVYDAGKQAEYDKFWDNFQNKGKRVAYNYGFGGSGWNVNNFYPKYDMQPTVGASMFCFCIGGVEGGSSGIYVDLPERLEECGVTLDFSKCTSMTNMFHYSYFTRIGVVDTASCTSDLNSTFGYLQRCTTIDKIISYEHTRYAGTFQYSYKLVHVIIEGVIARSGFNIKWATGLDKESITSIMVALSTTTSELTVTLPKTAVNNAFGIDIDDPTTYPEGSEFYELRHSRDNWTINYA